MPANFKTLFGKGGQGCVGFACVLQHVLAQDDGALEEGLDCFDFSRGRVVQFLAHPDPFPILKQVDTREWP